MSDLITDIVKIKIKEAMRAKEKEVLTVLRMIQAEFKQFEIDNREDVTNDVASKILMSMKKKRLTSIDKFSGEEGSENYIEKEKFELSVIEKFLPDMLGESDVKAIISSVVAETNASSIKDMGKVMGLLSSKLKGKADMTMVNKIVKEILA